MASSSDHSTASITSRAFAVRRKGFDPDEVRAYLGQLSEVISRLTAERDGARGEAEELRSDAAVRPEIDEDQLTAVLGEETARVLSSARKAATEMKDRAEESASRMLREAAAEAGDTRRRAEADAARLRDEAAAVRTEADEARRSAAEEAEAAAVRLREEAQAEAEAILAAAREEQARAEEAATGIRAQADAEAAVTRGAAEEVLAERTAEAELVAAALREQGEADAAATREQAGVDAAAIAAAAEEERESRQAEGREMVAEAQRVRERMLADLARRRKAARVQLEQLQAGRDRLLESYEAVQRELDAATSGLRGALPEARAAAEAARVRAEAEPADTVDQLEAQIGAARSADLPLVAPDAGPDEAEATGEPTVDLTDGADGPTDEAEVIDLDAEADLAAAPEDGAADDAAAAPTPPTTGPGASDPSSSVDIEEVGGDTGGAAGAPTEPPAAIAADDEAGADPVVAEDDAEVGPTGADDGEEGEEVEELFARLRASRTAAVDEAHQVLDAAAPGATAEEGTAPEADTAAAEAPTEVVSFDPAPDATAPDATAPDATAPEAPPEPEVAEPGGADAEAAELVTLLERRDGAIEPIEHRVARRLKRVLADEQGRVLDGVRRTKGAPVLDEILPQDDQVRAYTEAVTEDLLAAAEEGAAFEGAVLPSATSVEAVALDLGRSLAAMVRPRVARCFEAGDDPEDTSDRLRATYREWKTDSLVDATRHHVLAGFGEGQCAVRPAGSPVRWVADPATSACPDCEDDALAGTVASGEAFPTGHAHPPAHPGCRCLVIGERVGAPA